MRVNFERRFVNPPKVVIFLNFLNLDKNRNWRLNVRASDVDTNGFTLRDTDTWGDTDIRAAQACWIAYSDDREYIFSTSINDGPTARLI